MVDISQISTEQLLSMRQQAAQPAQPAQQPVQQPAQQNPLASIPTEQLIQQRDANTSKSQQDLIGQLGGRLPSQNFIPRQIRGGMAGPMGVAVPTDNPAFIEEQARREAFTKLTEQGFTPEQLELSLKAGDILEGPRIGRTTGGIGGALAATAIGGRFIPGPFDDAGIIALALASGGAGLGGIAGEATQTAIEEKRLVNRREVLGAFANEALTEAGGRGVVRGLKFAASPFIKQAVPEAAALIDDFAKVGGSFSPTELDKRFTLRVGEAFSRGSFGAKEIFQEFEEKQGKAVLAYADNMINSISEGVARQTPEEIGNIFADGITRPGGRVLNILDELVDPLYKQVDELASAGRQSGIRQARKGGPAVRGVKGQFQPAREARSIKLSPTVSTKSLKKFAEKHLATNERLNGQFLSDTGKSKLQKIIGMEEKLSFSDMRTLRSSFLKDSRKLARDVDQSQNIIKQLAGITDDAIFNPAATKGISPEALNLLRNTNSLYKAGKSGIQTTFSENLAKRLLKNPSSVIKEVFPANNPKAIRSLRQSLVEPISGKPNKEGKALWNQLRQEWLADVVDQSTKEGVAKPKVFNNLIRKATPQNIAEMFPEKELSGNVKKLQNLFEVAGKTPGGGTSLFSRSAQLGGLAMMYQGAKEGDFVGFTAGSTLAIGPLAFAKLATSPKGIKALTAGFRMKAGAKGLVPNAVRMVRLLKEIDTTEQKRKAAQQKELKRQQRLPALQKKLTGFGL